MLKVFAWISATRTSILQLAIEDLAKKKKKNAHLPDDLTAEQQQCIHPPKPRISRGSGCAKWVVRGKRGLRVAYQKIESKKKKNNSRIVVLEQ